MCPPNPTVDAKKPDPTRIPHRIETQRLVLRCYEPTDAETVRVVCAANREHLVEFMPWARADPQTLDEKLELVLGFRSQYDAGKNHIMGIFDGATGALVGGTGLHPGAARFGFEIGYWIIAEREGQGLVSEAVRALSLVALRLGHGMVTVRMAPENTRSEAVVERLGFRREGLVRNSFLFGDDPPRDTVQFTLLPAELEASDWVAATEASVRGFDALGRPVDLSRGAEQASSADSSP
ncbi:MAG: GNAT family protein [Planctomycetota bacterium]|nr:GNAT family protein [Planctomycetota bacterium]